MVVKKCKKCGNLLDKSNFIDLNSNFFFPEGRSDICNGCFANYISKSENNLAAADKVLQYLDIPFFPDEWMRLYPLNEKKTISIYCKMYKEGKSTGVDWVEANKRWKELEENKELLEKIPQFKEEETIKLKQKWGFNYTEEELSYMENLYAGIINTQNINGALQVDDTMKICKISLMIDERIRAGEDFKNLLDSYEKLMKAADLTPKNVKNANDFDSAGEIFAYLEKVGFKPTYYNDVEKDIVDSTMKSIQSWSRYLYTNENSIPSDIENRISALKSAQDLEDSLMDYSEEEMERYENETMNLEDEEFQEEII